MQLAPVVVSAAGAHQDSSVGRHRRAAAGAALPQHHHGQHHGHHHNVLPAQGGSILTAFLRRRSASAPRHASTRIVTSCAVATATSTTTRQQQQQQQQASTGPDLGFPRTLVQDYVLLQTIGKGGNGVVSLAQRRDEQAAEGGSARKFAVKSIPKVLKEGSELKRANHLSSVQREITVLKRLRGSLNVVSLEAVYEDDTHVHLVMEHCAGGELTEAISERHHSERAVASYMRAVLRTLAQCHAHHILHRDVKPGNFMLLSRDERAPIRAIDFGLATPFDPEELPCTNLGLEGTPWFMAPEVLSSKVLPASDLWSAGVMCFQLLTGRMPFDDKNNPGNPSINAIWRSILFDQIDFTKPWWRGISQEAKDFVRLLLERDPAKRPTAKEALRHPWLVGDSSDRSAGRKLQRSVVARIQRFAGSSAFKRSVLEMIALELHRHPECQVDCHGSDDWSSSSAMARGGGAGDTCNPVPASLQHLYSTLTFDPVSDDVPATEVAASLKRQGFRLTDDEVERLLEQLDPSGSGRVTRAALAASQIDWRQLQASDRARWVDLARQVFTALDKDSDGVLLVSEMAEQVMRVLPSDEAELNRLVRQAMDESSIAAAATTTPATTGHSSSTGAAANQLEDDDEEGGAMARHLGGSTHQQLLGGFLSTQVHDPQALGAGLEAGINFEGFLRLLKANSVDSLDMYDDRAAGGSSLHSIDRLNAALHRSGTNGALSSSGSRHGTRHGAASSLASGSVDSTHGSWLVNGSLHGGGAGGTHGALYGRESLWRFDVGSAAGAGVAAVAPVSPVLAPGQSSAASSSLVAPPAAAAAALPSKPTNVVWRFDVAGAGSGRPAATSPAAPVWRFDVAGPQPRSNGAGGGGIAAALSGSRPAGLGADAVAVNGLAGSSSTAGGGGNGAVVPQASAWRFDVGERSDPAAGALAAPSTAQHQGSLLFADARRGSVGASQEGGGRVASLAAEAAGSAGVSPLAAAADSEQSGGGGGAGRGPLGGWYDARQHGSKLFATALGKARAGGALPPVDENGAVGL